MKYLRIYIAIFSLLSSAGAQAKCDLTRVDSLEAKEAIELLTSCQETENEYFYYIKLGDSHFRNSDWANAILNYERARTFNSSDSRLIDNLSSAYSMTNNGAKTLMISEIRSAKHLVASPHLRDYWVFLSLALLLASLFIFFRSQKTKGAHRPKFLPPFIGVTVVSLALTFYSLAQEKEQAIIMTDAVSVYDSTSGTTEAISVLNSGYKVDVIELKADWAKVRLATNQQVWVKATSLELVLKK